MLISMVLITSMTTIPNIQSQSPIQSQPLSSTTDITQIVTQIAERVAASNPGTNADFVEQILIELAKNILTKVTS
jgi:hypothetical protein